MNNIKPTDDDSEKDKKEKQRQYMKEYKEKNREKALEYAKNYYQKNKEKFEYLFEATECPYCKKIINYQNLKKHQTRDICKRFAEKYLRMKKNSEVPDFIVIEDEKK